MESKGPGESSGTAAGRGLRDLLSADMIWLAWAPVVLIGVLHYATGTQHHWAHDVLRRLYYVPILLAAFSRGLRGGLAVSIVSTLSYAPHAFFVMPAIQDPGTTLNKLLEIVLYNSIGAIAGVLADREGQRRRQAERALEEQRRMADQLVRAGRLAALGELVAGVAHEIKNPLHTIKGTAEIVDEVIPADAEQAAMWRVLLQEVDRLEKIAERFLSFARPAQPDLRSQTAREVHARVRELLRAHVHASPGVRLEVDPLAPEAASAAIEADSDQLAQVLLNIASNGLRALEGKGRLQFGMRLDDRDGGSFVAFRLENDGPIIAPADLERIFDPFFTRFDAGTGLGLAIAARIVEAHGGYLEAENTGSERGVAFTVRLPVAGAAS